MKLHVLMVSLFLLSSQISVAKPQNKHKFVVTAYSSSDKGVGKYTYTGKRVRKGMVAVDPKVIPLHSRIYIPGYGHAIAEDIGGGVKGRHIDVYMPSRGGAIRWGRKRLYVQIIPSKRGTRRH